jgi:hypothetical protein
LQRVGTPNLEIVMRAFGIRCLSLSLSVFVCVCCLSACGTRALTTSDAGETTSDTGESTDLKEPSTGADAAPPSSCPATQPPIASACSIVGQVCPYATSQAQTVYRCRDGLWQQIVGVGSTEDCPASPPAEHTPCAGSLVGRDCFYEHGTCTASSIIQCDGAVWRHVNGCPSRSPVSCKLRLDLKDVQLAFHHPSKQLDQPALALSGTQLMVALKTSGGGDPAHAIHAVRFDTSRPVSLPATKPTSASRVGRDAVSTPALVFSRDSFLLGWAANDGWPAATNHQPGVFVRSLPLKGPRSADVLVDDEGLSVPALALWGERGWIGSRFPVKTDLQKRAAALASIDAKPLVFAGSRVVVADEAAETPWFAKPVPLATVRAASWSGGFIMAFPVVASGDLTDDSGILVDFLKPQASGYKPYKRTRLAVSLPSRISLAALDDGSAIVAYRGQWDDAPKSAPLFRVQRVYPDGKVVKVSSLATYFSDPLGSGPHVVPFDNGYLVAWTTINPTTNGGGTLHAQIYSSQNMRRQLYEQPLDAIIATDRLAVAYADVDRSLHLAWSAMGADGYSRIHRQRMICGSD